MSKELIGRAEYRWKWGKTDYQISGEAAFNKLDNVSLGLLDPPGLRDYIPREAASVRGRYEGLVRSAGRSTNHRQVSWRAQSIRPSARKTGRQKAKLPSAQGSCHVGTDAKISANSSDPPRRPARFGKFCPVS